MGEQVKPLYPNKHRLVPRIRRKILTEFVGSMRDQPCFIFACGPSLNKIDPYIQELHDNFFTVGINRSYEKIEPNILFFQDVIFSNENHDKMKELKDTLLVYREGVCDLKGIAYRYRICEGWALANTLIDLYGTGTSLPLAFQIAWTFKCNPIIIVGADCKYAPDGSTDFFGNNPWHHSETISRAAKGLEWVEKQCKDKNISLINASENFIDIGDIIKSLPRTSRQTITERLRIDI